MRLQCCLLQASLQSALRGQLYRSALNSPGTFAKLAAPATSEALRESDGQELARTKLMQVTNTTSKQLTARYLHSQSNWSFTAGATAMHAESGGMLVQPGTSNTTTVDTDLCLVPRSVITTSYTSWRPLTTSDTFRPTHSRPATDTDPCQVPDCTQSEPAGSHAPLSFRKNG